MSAESFLSNDEFQDCRNLSRKITTYLVENKWDIQPSTPMNFDNNKVKDNIGDGFYISSIPGEDFDNLMKITADDRGNIYIPSKKAYSRKIKLEIVSEINRILFGAIVHESTHILQNKIHSDLRDEDIEKHSELSKIQHATHEENFELYIGRKLETEARAAQAAAEILFCCNPNINENFFSYLFLQTHVVERTANSIGEKGSGSTTIDDWWIKFEDMAWDFYKKYV